MNEQLDTLREQLSFEKQQREWREARILSVARKEKELTCAELGERFGMTDSGMYDFLRRHGEKRELSDLRRGDWRRTGLKYSYWKRRVG